MSLDFFIQNDWFTLHILYISAQLQDDLHDDRRWIPILVLVSWMRIVDSPRFIDGFAGLFNGPLAKYVCATLSSMRHVATANGPITICTTHLSATGS